jgi:uncharacterized membrane protein YbhN (UPF0104 family)
MSTPDDSAVTTPEGRRHSRRWLLWAGLLVLGAAAVFVALPALTGVPARLTRGCGVWIAAAGVLELLSAVGFVLVFKLVFAASSSWRRGIPAALRGLGASTILPGGGLIGPTTGAWSSCTEKPSFAQLTRSTTTFVILTNAPGAVVLTVTGVLLWLGLSSGPRQTAVTILPALVAVGLLTATWLAGHMSRRTPRPPQRSAILRALAKPARTMSDGVSDACALLAAGNWKLSGAVAYYAFDNAVLWAAFHAFGHTPAISVIVMGYLVGSIAGALPLPAGLGVVDGGLIGALVLYGSPAAPAVAAVLLYRGISLSAPIALGAIGWAHRPTRRRSRRHANALRGTAPELATVHVERS